MASTLVIDEEVAVPLLLEYPTAALLPILRRLKGWDQVLALVINNNDATAYLIKLSITVSCSHVVQIWWS